MSETSSLLSIAVITSLLSCGLLLPVWIMVFAVIIIVKLFSPEPVHKQPEVKTILPSNDFADEWEFVILPRS